MFKEIKLIERLQICNQHFTTYVCAGGFVYTRCKDTTTDFCSLRIIEWVFCWEMGGLWFSLSAWWWVMIFLFILLLLLCFMMTWPAGLKASIIFLCKQQVSCIHCEANIGLKVRDFNKIQLKSVKWVGMMVHKIRRFGKLVSNLQNWTPLLLNGMSTILWKVKNKYAKVYCNLTVGYYQAKNRDNHCWDI